MMPGIAGGKGRVRVRRARLAGKLRRGQGSWRWREGEISVFFAWNGRLRGAKVVLVANMRTLIRTYFSLLLVIGLGGGSLIWAEKQPPKSDSPVKIACGKP